MNINNLSLAVARQIFHKCLALAYKNPELDLEPTLFALKERIESDPLYQKGLQIYEEARANSGIEHNYCRPTDYYFAVMQEEIVNANGAPIGKKHVKLLLCFKWNWWLNGESYFYEEEQMVRNFSNWLPWDMYENLLTGGELTNNVEELRFILQRVGLEEKPELIECYNRHCHEIHYGSPRYTRLNKTFGDII